MQGNSEAGHDNDASELTECNSSTRSGHAGRGVLLHSRRSFELRASRVKVDSGEARPRDWGGGRMTRARLHNDSLCCRSVQLELPAAL